MKTPRKPRPFSVPMLRRMAALCSTHTDDAAMAQSLAALLCDDGSSPACTAIGAACALRDTMKRAVRAADFMASDVCDAKGAPTWITNPHETTVLESLRVGRELHAIAVRSVEAWAAKDAERKARKGGTK